MRTRKFGFETVSTVGTISWNNPPSELKNVGNLNILIKRQNYGVQMIVPIKHVESGRKLGMHITKHKKQEKTSKFLRRKPLQCSEVSSVCYLQTRTRSYKFCYCH